MRWDLSWVLVAAGLPGGAAAAATLHVPGDHVTIQSAINASVDGDVVLVGDGTYIGPENTNLDFGGRLITLRSSGGAAACIIDCQPTPQRRGFHFHGGETAAAVVDGFTIREGFIGNELNPTPAFGGGLLIENSSPTIVNCIITDNAAVSNGLALGGGVYSAGGSPTFINCSIDSNGAAGNNGSAGGGGIRHGGGLITLINCAFTGNGTGSDFQVPAGGGALIDAGLLVNCTFSGNVAKQGGGLSGSGLTLINCTFSGNRLTTTGNFPTSGGGGFSGTGALTSCIFWGNTGLFDALDQIQAFGNTTVDYSDVQGGWNGNGVNNIDADPGFVNPHGVDGFNGTPDDDLRLRPGSPCIDAGDSAAVPVGVNTDKAGSAREVDDLDTPDCPQAPGNCGAAPVVDMGAYEYHLPCPWDLDYSGSVGAGDFQALLLAWGARPAGAADFDGDGSVGVRDFLALLAHWGPCCGPADAGQPDCDGDGFADGCNIDAGQSFDCNRNSVPDECDLASGTSLDCNGDIVPDECQLVDCNGNGIEDSCDISSGTSRDCNFDGVPDECQSIGCDGCTDELIKLFAADGAAGDRFGTSVSVSGNRALVGAPLDDDAGSNAGAVYVFRFDGSTWAQETKLAPGSAAGAQVGKSVALEGGVAVLGGFGSAWVYRMIGTQWIQEGHLVPAVPVSDFAASVAISDDVIVVGAPNTTGGAGSAHVYRFDGATWIEEAVLPDPDSEQFDFFALSVSVSGDVILAGDIGNIIQGTPPGQAYVFRYDGAQWALEATLTASDGAGSDQFGIRVSVRDGVALVGAAQGNRNGPGTWGSAYVFRHNGAAWVEEAELTNPDLPPGGYITTSVVVSYDVDVVAMGTSSPGAAFVFMFDGAQWARQARLTGSNAQASDDFGGNAVSLGNGIAFVGADQDDGLGNNSGAAYVYRSLSDCNRTGELDLCELLSGAAGDANGDGLPDECGVDCNINAVPDGDDIAAGTSQDCNGNGVPDECDTDDCNHNGLADSCDIAAGTSQDCNNDGLPDECGPDDCNGNGIADSCDIDSGTSADCNRNGVPDECEPDDCNGNGSPDSCDLDSGASADCNGNGVPDECEPLGPDCNNNGIMDDCDILAGTSTDFDANGVPDECPFFPYPNDWCNDPGPIGEGVFPFTTVTALTDGLPASCSGGPGFAFVNDIWFLYTPSCVGTATFSVCNAASFDTRLAVYFAGACPPTGGACSDNAPGCGQTSEVQMVVHPLLQYLVRVGATAGEGSGTLTVTCHP